MAEALKSVAKPSLEEFLQTWASHNISRAAMLANPALPQSEFVFARYQIGGLAAALREAGYVK